MENRRELLNEIGLEDSVVFENPSYDDAIIGYDELTNKIIYDFEKMVEYLMKTDGMTYEDSVDFIEYNTIRALPYFEGAPIVMRGIEHYMDYYDADKQFNTNYSFDANYHLNKCVEWVKQWFDENGKDCNAVIGMSGGKDSTIAAAILCLALGCNRVIGVAMPDEGQGIEDADKICKFLGMKYICAPIDKITAPFKNMSIEYNSTDFEWSNQTTQNIPPRIRMTMLYAIAQSNNGRVVNTCNLSEDYIGYSTLWGDSVGSFSPIKNFTVTEILAIGDELGLPKEWVHKTPDDGLPHSMPDEEKFGFTYSELDEWIRTKVTPFDDEKTQKIMRMHKNNLFKTQITNIPSYNPNLPVY